MSQCDDATGASKQPFDFHSGAIDCASAWEGTKEQKNNLPSNSQGGRLDLVSGRVAIKEQWNKRTNNHPMVTAADSSRQWPRSNKRTNNHPMVTAADSFASVAYGTN
jgi:hypothetical protein